MSKDFYRRPPRHSANEKEWNRWYRQEKRMEKQRRRINEFSIDFDRIPNDYDYGIEKEEDGVWRQKGRFSLK